MADRALKMEASGATQDVHSTWEDTVPQPRPPFADEPRPREPKPHTTAPGTDPFRLGFRHRLRTTGNGRETVEQVPLRAEDLLYPQEGDVVSDGFPHSWGLQPKADSIRRHHMQRHPDTLVTSNVVLVLRSDGKNCSPDVAVIEGGIDFSEIERAVNLRDAGGRLVFALEVVSTSEKAIEKKDTEDNVDRYAAEKVAEYFTVYPVRERRVKDLVGRTLVKGGYEEIPPDGEGRVYSAKLDLFFQIDAKSEELLAIDAKTGQRLLISDEEEAGRKKAEAALGEAEAAREQEAEARRQAEACVEQEAEARRQAEERVEQGLRRGVEDLCAVLGLAWGAERNAQVEHMSVPQLETLRAYLVSEKSWPESFPDA
ncbi:MAG: Uma2 family endonuclease [bacterium]|nr:Uma2 family endonuclease [bacterium]